jgi:hypothetical protein
VIGYIGVEEEQKIRPKYKAWNIFKHKYLLKYLLGNWIFSPLRIMDNHLKVLTLNFRLGNADFHHGILWESWNGNTKISPANDEKRFSNMNNFWNPIGLLNIYLYLRIMENPLRVLRLNFRLGNAYFDFCTMESIEIVTRKCQQKIIKIDFQPWITFEILSGNGIFAPLRIIGTPLNV